MSAKFLYSSVVLAGVLVASAATASAQLGQATVPPTLDGDLSEWGTDSLTSNTGAVISSGTVGAQYRFFDLLQDDTGDGDYQYPAAWGAVPNNGPLATTDLADIDIERFYFAYDSSNIYIAYKLNSSNSPYGIPRTAIYIDRTDFPGGSDLSTLQNGHQNFCQAPDVQFDPSFLFDYHFSNRGPGGAYGYRTWATDVNGNPESGDRWSFPGPVQEFDSNTNGVIEMSVPWSAAGGYPLGPINLRLFVGLGSEDGSNWRDVLDVGVNPWEAGGGCVGGGGGTCDGPLGPSGTDFDADIFDAIGAASQAAQEADLTATCNTAPAVVTNSFITIPLNLAPPPVLNAANERLYFSNDIVRFNFNLAATGPTVTNLANYTVVGDVPDDITVTGVSFGTGTEAGNIFLQLSRTVSQAETGSLQIQLDNSIVSDGAVPIAAGTVLDINQFQYIIPITVDAGDESVDIGDPFVQGAWDSFSGRSLLTDGVDPLPGMPGSQVEPGDIPGDNIYRGRLFTLTDPTLPIQDNFVVKSDYNFGALLNNPANNPRQLSIGYWLPYNFDPLYQFNSGIYEPTMDPIVIVKPASVPTRLSAVNSTVTINLKVPNNFLYFDTVAASTPGTITMYCQAGPTFGGDNALPTLPSSDMAGEQDVNTLSKVLTYINSDVNFHYYTATVTYPAGIPDITGLRFGYDYTGFGLFRENELAGDPQQPVITGVDSSIHKDRTIHRHVVRVTNNANTGGRTLDLTFDETNLDVALTPIPGDADGDFSLTVADVTAINNHIAGIVTLTGQNLTNAASIAAPNGSVTAADSAAVIAAIVP